MSWLPSGRETGSDGGNHDWDSSDECESIIALDPTRCSGLAHPDTYNASRRWPARIALEASRVAALAEVRG